MDIDWEGYLNDPRLAAGAIARVLHAGRLALFLGAGVSKAMGVPTWHTLARLMVRDAKLPILGINRKKDGSVLADAFSRVSRKDPVNFEKNVKKWLYYRWNKPAGNWASDTLVGLGALMSGTNRGRVDTALTLNFDSFLEMYLRLYGCIPQTITTFPCLIGRADVKIFHSHGYLPFDAEDGSDTSILLNKQTYLEEMGADSTPRRKMMQYVFGHKTMLAVGLSGDDTYSSAILSAIAKQSGEPLMGYWIIGPNEPASKVADLKEMKMAAVKLPSFNFLPEFLFMIAREAASLMRKSI